MNDETPARRRRVRYPGTHPRNFGEKYKELDPEAFETERQKVMDRGQTPAGTHRPICVQEILQILNPHPGDVGLDATLGYGGHAQELLPRMVPGGCLFGLDVDPIELPRTEARLRGLGFDESALQVRRMNFAGLLNLLPEIGGPLDFILADLGVSSMQIDNPVRGFTYKFEGPLDLRLNPRRGQPASQWIQTHSAEEIETILRDHADEPHAIHIAKALVGQEIQTTTQLARVVREVLQDVFPRAEPNLEIRKVLQRTFQALRIAVNDEFGVLEQFLGYLPSCLKSGGRVAILSFHSGEDRRVKKAFQQGLREGLYHSIASEPIRPSPQEQRSNPRSSCAKLRWAIRNSSV